MTSALQDRRGTQHAGSSTCVRRHAAHRARPGRTQARPPPGTRTLRARALAHGRSTPPQPSCRAAQQPTRHRPPRGTGIHHKDHDHSPGAPGQPHRLGPEPGRGNSCCSLPARPRRTQPGQRRSPARPRSDTAGTTQPGSSPASRARPAPCARWRRTQTPIPARHRYSPQASPDPIQMITGNAA